MNALTELNAATPGPWSYRPSPEDDWGTVRAPVTEQGRLYGGIICQARDPEALDPLTLAAHREAKTDPWEANARLIAAAPELLAALEFITNVARATGGFSPMALQQADATIAKATGASA